MVHAGAKGNRKAVICALEFSPMQLRIADEASAEISPQTQSKPQIARINQFGSLQAENWSPA
jgi:septum site-determining protein MinC